MFKYISRVLNKVKYATDDNQTCPQQVKNEESLVLDLNDNISKIKNRVNGSSDIVFREFSFGAKKRYHAALIYIDGMTDKDIINNNIIKPLMYYTEMSHLSNDMLSNLNSIDDLKDTLISVGNVDKSNSINQLVNNCIAGYSIMLIGGFNEGLVISTIGWETRSIEESKTETVVRGPRESFNENLRTNTTLLRRRIKSSDLIFTSLKIGERTNTDICIAYIKDLAMPGLVDEVKERLSRIKTDSILESGYIEGFIEDAPFSIFATVANSEKPDVIAAKILEGRVAIFVDGTPIVLSVPMLFTENFQTSEDYYSRPYYVSLIRMLRYLSYFISILIGAIYVALVTFHQELIPTTLLFTLASTREGVPFPALFETVIMIIVFEILREAGVRLPRPVGQAVSIVGALVLGDSAVAAGLIAPLTVIIVAITAISSFLVPAQTDSASILRLIMLLFAGFMGMYGIAVGLLLVLVYLSSLRSFGYPYFAPLAPFIKADMKDTFIRKPIWAMNKRPSSINTQDSNRQSNNLKPHPPSDSNQIQDKENEK